jgi:hypothetical protein
MTPEQLGHRGIPDPKLGDEEGEWVKHSFSKV